MNSLLGFLKPEDMSLFTDFYELTMCASYFDNKNFEPATFDLFIRRLPENRSYFLFAGLEQILLYLQNIKFTDEHLAYLKKQGFNQQFLNYLRDFKFTGDVWAVPEGTVAFPNEPLVRITAPIIEAQMVETFILNTVNLQTTIATKASRVSPRSKRQIRNRIWLTSRTGHRRRHESCSSATSQAAKEPQTFSQAWFTTSPSLEPWRTPS